LAVDDFSGAIRRDVCLAPYTTLRVGGPAEFFARAASADELAGLIQSAQGSTKGVTVLGWGSNVLPADGGVSGLVVLNEAGRIDILDEGVVQAETGCGFQELLLKCAQAGLGGLEFAVGIPGTLGGALVSNAGAYRRNVSEFVTEIEIADRNGRRWVRPDWMGFSYRDSVMRHRDAPHVALLQVRLRLAKRPAAEIYAEAREYQRQRISKQPAPASAGSFFKNVYDAELIGRLHDLPPPLKKAGVVPAGYLLEMAGLKGYRMGPAMFGVRHANFLLNVGGAKAGELRALAEFAKREVFLQLGVKLEEEVLYLGNW
jgi:UDP-N-acetylmuramate dehydrogenase